MLGKGDTGMLQTALQHPWLLAALALVCVGGGVGIGLLIGKKRLRTIAHMAIT